MCFGLLKSKISSPTRLMKPPNSEAQHLNELELSYSSDKNCRNNWHSLKISHRLLSPIAGTKKSKHWSDDRNSLFDVFVETGGRILSRFKSTKWPVDMQKLLNLLFLIDFLGSFLFWILARSCSGRINMHVPIYVHVCRCIYLCNCLQVCG